jgi:serine/threonine protein kinase
MNELAPNPQRKYCLNCFAVMAQAIRHCPNCQYPQPEQYDTRYLPPQFRLCRQYFIGRVLGCGGFGVTYLAYDRNLGTRVAIKEYFPSAFASRGPDGLTVLPAAGQDGELFRSGREKFIAEARLLASLRSHHIITIRHFFEECNTAYFVMEYLEGETLESYLTRKGGKLPPAEVRKLLFPLLEALDEVHELKSYHRDIKPENIYMSRKGTPILLDFGSARQQLSGSSEGVVFLTPGYAPLEQYAVNGIQGPWTDIYALAATWYRALTGITPPPPQERQQKETLYEPSRLGVEISPEEEKFLMTGLSLKWSSRPESITEWRMMLEGRPADEAFRKRLEQEDTFIKLVILPKLNDLLLTPAEEQEVYQAATYMNIPDERVRMLIDRTLEQTSSVRGDPIADKFVQGWLKNLYGDDV